MNESAIQSTGDPSSILDDSKLVDQIIRVDTGALLTIIRELEVKLSEHHRQVRKLLRQRSLPSYFHYGELSFQYHIGKKWSTLSNIIFQDKIPQWALALTQRIDNLERNGMTSTPRKHVEGNGTLSLNEFTSDER